MDSRADRDALFHTPLAEAVDRRERQPLFVGLCASCLCCVTFRAARPARCALPHACLLLRRLLRSRRWTHRQPHPQLRRPTVPPLEPLGQAAEQRAAPLPARPPASQGALQQRPGPATLVLQRWYCSVTSVAGRCLMPHEQQRSVLSTVHLLVLVRTSTS